MMESWVSIRKSNKARHHINRMKGKCMIISVGIEEIVDKIHSSQKKKKTGSGRDFPTRLKVHFGPFMLLYQNSIDQMLLDGRNFSLTVCRLRSA